jgi:hypothetical protein
MNGKSIIDGGLKNTPERWAGRVTAASESPELDELVVAK